VPAVKARTPNGATIEGLNAECRDLAGNEVFERNRNMLFAEERW
jgi:hypothetical protein